MALESCSDGTRGIQAYHDFSRNLLGSLDGSRAVIIQRVRYPTTIATVAEIEVRLLQWESDLRKLVVFKEPLPSESVQLSTLRDIVPQELKEMVKNQKPKTSEALKKLLRDEAREQREESIVKKHRAGGKGASRRRERARGRGSGGAVCRGRQGD